MTLSWVEAGVDEHLPKGYPVILIFIFLYAVLSFNLGCTTLVSKGIICKTNIFSKFTVETMSY